MTRNLASIAAAAGDTIFQNRFLLLSHLAALPQLFYSALHELFFLLSTTTLLFLFKKLAHLLLFFTHASFFFLLSALGLLASLLLPSNFQFGFDHCVLAIFDLLALCFFRILPRLHFDLKQLSRSLSNALFLRFSAFTFTSLFFLHQLLR
ncbi:hypothetical protein PINS_up022383 [Pythium insidiosum]|nr:hypothetical protein PINS_up022383 [Pythium insidiosum]